MQLDVFHGFLLLLCVVLHYHGQCPKCKVCKDETATTATTVADGETGQQVVIYPVNSPPTNDQQYLKICEAYQSRIIPPRLQIAPPAPIARFDFALVSDLDHKSRHPELFRWHSVFKRGTLALHPRDGFSIEWGNEYPLTSSSARNNRSMELSELVMFRHLLLAICDYTGSVYRITVGGRGSGFTQDVQPNLIQR